MDRATAPLRAAPGCRGAGYGCRVSWKVSSTGPDSTHWPPYSDGGLAAGGQGAAGAGAVARQRPRSSWCGTGLNLGHWEGSIQVRGAGSIVLYTKHRLEHHLCDVNHLSILFGIPALIRPTLRGTPSYVSIPGASQTRTGRMEAGGCARSRQSGTCMLRWNAERHGPQGHGVSDERRCECG